MHRRHADPIWGHPSDQDTPDIDLLPESSSPSATRFPGDEYGFEIARFAGRVRAVFGGIEIASTTQALRLSETRLAPVFYFPRRDVRLDLMSPTPRRTYCPFRGNATYWRLRVGEQEAQDVAWSYDEPFHDARRIAGYVAFDAARLERLELEPDAGTPVREETPYPNPLVGWLLHRAPEAASIIDLVEQFTEVTVAADIPLWRLWLNVRTLHPQLFSTSYTWEKPEPGASGSGVVERTVHHGILRDIRFLDSPMRPIFEGAGGVRRRLEGPSPQLDFPIVKDHRQAGATDYVAMPVTFSDGQINAISLTTKSPGGFSTRDLGFVYEVLPALSRFVEVHAARRKSISLLQTFLGRQTGERVLKGLVRRGDRDEIRSVIWFCDLRESTRLGQALSPDAYLALLNDYYDCLAAPVLTHGGEILRFIGDAALAIFPIEGFYRGPGNGPEGAREACRAALAAAREGRARFARMNDERERAGLEALGFGLGLHLGWLTYGNVGTEDRLEFTVVGPEANLAARLQDLCKTVDRAVLVSDRFAEACPEDERGELEPIGDHPLRGFSAPTRVFALAEPSAPSRDAA